jgi:hypothetical protein
VTSQIEDTPLEGVVELGGIEPPSISRWTNPLRPFPSLGLTQPRRRVG